ncbi:fatty acyl-CoA reductase 1-like [Anopheles ziemanni]|uniref:fatty acyl-CoA reductase 1-like n=1 Tax=Anopheles ziemanni TaxID=345580 RepID=UPI00266023D9|nr:fatty acyl-CoA reductase 1-like [Anopheles ziemanni]
MADSTPKLSVCDFYRNAVVLITGGSGFMGKVLVEKLLRSFEVKKIYLLLRERRNVKPSERLKQIINDPIFNTIRRTVIHPDALFAKLESIDVDFTSEEIVREPQKTELLTDTQIVFHVIGDVNLTNNLQNSLENNVTTAEKLYSFIRNARNLRSIVHVSTFYSNCDRSHIEEQIYDDIPFGGLHNIRRILDALTESERDALTPTILGQLPNAYVFSKKCAEVMVQQQFADLPMGIFRPPVVNSSYQEPAPGWVDGIQATTGLSVAILQQRLVWYQGNPASLSTIAPADYCIAAMITAACDIRARHDERKKLESFNRTVPCLPVYNFAFENPLNWKQFIAYVGSGLPTAIERALSTIRVRLTRRPILSRITFWLLYLQAYLADFLRCLIRKPKRHVKAISSLQRLHTACTHFLSNSWTARNDNVKRMRSLLLKEEEKLLEFDVDLLDWEDYFRNYVSGFYAYIERKQKRGRD